MAVIKNIDGRIGVTVPKSRATKLAASALPARALRDRLQNPEGPGVPSWASFLPAALQAAAHADAAERTSEASPETRRGAPGGAQAAPAPETMPERERPPACPSAWWTGRVWELSRTAQGCRQVQQALDDMPSPRQRGALAAELRGHLAEGVRCPFANYVLAKCIQVCEPAHVQFIVDELLTKGPAALAQVARHKYGCRIVQRLLEILPTPRVAGLCEALLQHGADSCSHPYGNYAMQHLVEFGEARFQRAVVALLIGQVGSVGENRYLCAVVVKALTFASHADRLELSAAMRATPGLLDALSETRHGRIASRLGLEAQKAEAQTPRRRSAAVCGGA